MTSSSPTCDRRDFIERLGLTTAGFGLGFGIFSTTISAQASTQKNPDKRAQHTGTQNNGFSPNVYIHISEDGSVTIVCHRSEMGQGIRSSIPVLLADELGATMDRVRVIQADGDKAYGDQNTDGSNSIRGFFDDLRFAAATVRTILCDTAAKRWRVDPKTCRASNHSVLHEASKRHIGFGDLVSAAKTMPIPKKQDVKLRPRKELKNLGKDLPLLDGPAYVTGQAKFGADISLPKMLVAVIARPPVVGGQVAHFDATKALAVPGVRKVIRMPDPEEPYKYQPWGGLAVLADHTWAAMQGRSALDVTWTHGANASYDSATFRETMLRSLREPGEVVRKIGDCAKAEATAARKIEAEYYVPHLAHVTMEPPVALAYFDQQQGRCEIWAPTQNPQAARHEVARMLGLAEDKIIVHVTFLGGGFGRKSKPDFILEAAYLSREAGVPVRVQFTREDDIQNDYLNTVSAQRLTAGLDQHGKLISWRHRTVFPPIASLFVKGANRPGGDDLEQGVVDMPLAVPNVLAETYEAQAHVRIGWLRSVYNIFHAFALNSFFDEIAQARGGDIRDVIFEVIGTKTITSPADLGVEKLDNYGATLAQHPIDPKRLRHVVDRVTEAAGWSHRRANPKRGLGLAVHRSFLSYAAIVAAVSQTVDGSIRVEEVWVSFDGGTIVNRDRVRAQMEGSVINGMTYALYGGVTHAKGIVQQTSFDTLPLVRMGQEPAKIHIDIVSSEAPPGGVGEPGLPPVAPAIGNAIFALTGQRFRKLPLS